MSEEKIEKADCFADGYEVYNWPEFKALAKRLGIVWELPTSRVQIDIPVDGPVEITQTYRHREMSVPKERIDECSSVENS